MNVIVPRAAGLVVAYTALIALADGMTKALAAGYAAAQMYALSGAVVVALCMMSARLKPGGESLRTTRPRAMAWRAGFTVLATICFFLAFRHLGFAEVFLFIGLMPLFSALLAGPMLGEQVSPVAWGALGAGFLGVLCLFPGGLAQLGFGHTAAMMAALCGTVSIMLSRHIGKFESNGLAQVLYPNAALLVVMAPVLPFVWQPMPVADLALAVGYGGVLFAARWLLVLALRGLAAHAVTSLMKLQFVWMVLIGAWVFGEWPTAQTYLGAGIIALSGLFLAYEEPLRRLVDRRAAQA